MRKICCIAAAFVLFSFAGCGDGVDLPSLGVETDLNKIILPDNNVNLVQVELKDNSVPMEKVGIHSEEDFARIREKKRCGRAVDHGLSDVEREFFLSEKYGYISG